jgi:phage regulator Rha-like protein
MNMDFMTFCNGERTMTSREIAELTGKRHDHVMTDIRKMLDELGLSSPDFSGEYKDSTGRTLPCFNLPKRETLILVSGYSIPMRARIVDRWEALETGKAKPAMVAQPYSAAVEAIQVVLVFWLINLLPRGKVEWLYLRILP